LLVVLVVLLAALLAALLAVLLVLLVFLRHPAWRLCMFTCLVTWKKRTAKESGRSVTFWQGNCGKRILPEAPPAVVCGATRVRDARMNAQTSLY
jgi:hypothetical protein